MINDVNTEPVKRKAEKQKEQMLTVLGHKISYSKAFGIAFLVIFILLFFPGIGITEGTQKK